MQDQNASNQTTDRVTTWQPIETHPCDRYILLCDRNAVDWDGMMEVGRWYDDEQGNGNFWSCGGPNGGLELDGDSHPGHYDRFTDWMDLPEPPK